MLPVLLFCLVVLLHFYYVSDRKIRMCRLPGPKAYPIIGNSHMFLGTIDKNTIKFFKMMREYPRMLALWIGPKLHVCLFKACDVEVVLKSKSMVKADEYWFLKFWLGDSILLSEGEKFKRNRKMVMPAFHTDSLKRYFQIYDRYSREFVKVLEKEVDGPEFDVFKSASLTTMFVLLETTMGVSKDTFGMEALKYVEATHMLGKCAFDRGHKPWLYPSIIFNFTELKKTQDKYLNVVEKLSARVIGERKKILATSNNDELARTSFLDKLLEKTDEHGQKMTDEEIKDETTTMLFAGQDTTALSLSYTMCLLGLNQDVQEKMLCEIDEVFGEGDRCVTYEDCYRLKYMQQVIQESWRLFPPIPFISKKPIEHIDLGDCIIPKDCMVGIAIGKVHRDPDQYPNPNQFDPDNFLPEQVQKRNPYSFLPFSMGQRTCIGSRYSMLLIKVALVHVLRNYRLLSTIPHDKYKLSPEMSLKRKDGFMMSLQRR